MPSPDCFWIIVARVIAPAAIWGVLALIVWTFHLLLTRQERRKEPRGFDVLPPK